jgi:hypothetical protein
MSSDFLAGQEWGWLQKPACSISNEALTHSASAAPQLLHSLFGLERKRYHRNIAWEGEVVGVEIRRGRVGDGQGREMANEAKGWGREGKGVRKRIRMGQGMYMAGKGRNGAGNGWRRGNGRAGAGKEKAWGIAARGTRVNTMEVCDSAVSFASHFPLGVKDPSQGLLSVVVFAQGLYGELWSNLGCRSTLLAVQARHSIAMKLILKPIMPHRPSSNTTTIAQDLLHPTLLSPEAL